MLILTPKQNIGDLGGKLLVPYKMNKAQLFLTKCVFIAAVANSRPPVLSESGLCVSLGTFLLVTSVHSLTLNLP